MALVGGQNREAASCGGGGYGDVLEAGIVRPRPVEHGAGLAGFLDSEGQDASGIEVLDRRKPAAQLSRFRGCADFERSGRCPPRSR